jgi:hypothetical protein
LQQADRGERIDADELELMVRPPLAAGPPKDFSWCRLFLHMLEVPQVSNT